MRTVMKMKTCDAIRRDEKKIFYVGNPRKGLLRKWDLR